MHTNTLYVIKDVNNKLLVAVSSSNNSPFENPENLMVADLDLVPNPNSLMEEFMKAAYMREGGSHKFLERMFTMVPYAEGDDRFYDRVYTIQYLRAISVPTAARIGESKLWSIKMQGVAEPIA